MRDFHIFSYAAIGFSLLLSIPSFFISIVAILWHFCFAQTLKIAIHDITKFLYFRSSHCQMKFQWHYINITINEGDSVTERYCYVADGIIRKSGTRSFNYLVLCVPWLVMSLLGVILDIAATVVYFSDYIKILSNFSEALSLLEVLNSDKVLPIFQEKFSHAVYPFLLAPQFMFLATSKCLIPLILATILTSLAIKATWETIKDNRSIQVYSKRTLAVPINVCTTLDNLTLSHENHFVLVQLSFNFAKGCAIVKIY
ncbi:CLUMA_CG007887, isoform A [Clunio marinus]|uniref:CLUMA_CG007887, isoform A n=1 Tax=Clunio marinus TaxID=568069 RepID=A0A1J1I3P2_9DIPT|nr:CLUMA_CG007887, isoform A [Clunio marinus]